MAVHSDVLVLDTKTQFMQALQRAVGDGFPHHTSGTVPLEKARRLVRKFRDTYLIHLTAQQRWRRKKLGLANARLFLWRERPDSDLTFVLLVSDGEHPAHDLEKLKDGRKDGQRLRLTGYELVPHQREGAAHHSWTWRMTKQTADDWRARILQAVRHQNRTDMAQAWYSLNHVPGFGGCRAQVRVLVKLFRAEWKRRSKQPWPLPSMRNRYVELMKLSGKPLYVVLEESKQYVSTS